MMTTVPYFGLGAYWTDADRLEWFTPKERARLRERLDARIKRARERQLWCELQAAKLARARIVRRQKW